MVAGIGSELIVDAYESDLVKLQALPSFLLTAHRKSAHIVPWMQSLLKSGKAGKVALNKQGWRGYIVPEPSCERMRCYYRHAQATPGKHQVIQCFVTYEVYEVATSATWLCRSLVL
jgi:hypothetical protein